MRKRVSTGFLATIMALQLITPAFAADISTPGTSSNAEVPLSVQATTLAVTVPTQLPVTVDSEGNHTYATNTQISNNSSGPIVVSNITMSASNGWQVSDYATDLTKSTVGTKKIGFEINGATTSDGDGALNDVVTNFGSITAGGAQKLSYTAKIPPQSQALDTTSVANVVFTVDWYTGGNNSVETEAGALSLDKDLIQMLPGTSEYIRAVYQDNQPQAIMLMDLMAEGSDVVWKSSDPSVATVSDGIVTGLQAGNSVITAQAGELTATCHVIVDELRVPLTAIDFSKHSTSIVNGASETVLVLYNPEKFTGTTNLTVTSSDTSVATVTPESLNGVTAEAGPSAITITGAAPGSAVITATATTDNGTVTSTLNVKIEQPLTGISIEGPTEVKVGETIQLTAKKIPENTTDTSPIVWSSNNSRVADVRNDGVILAVSEGYVLVSVKHEMVKTNYTVNVVADKSEPSGSPVAMTSFYNKDNTAWRTPEYRENIEEIRFVYSLDVPESIYGTGVGSDKMPWDISAQQDKSMLAWCTPQTLSDNPKYTLTIASRGGVLSIGEKAFQGCVSLVRAKLPPMITHIMESAFGGCGKLDMDYLPLNLVSIGASAFSKCESLSLNRLPDGVTVIDWLAFYGCSNIKIAELPPNLKTFGVSAFSGCESITALKISTDNKYLSTHEGVVYNKNQDAVIYCPTGMVGEVAILNTVHNIATESFIGCSKVTRVELSNTTEYIGSNAFRDCTALLEITIPNTLTRIYDGAFYGCSSLTAISIPDGITAIDDSAFRDCINITSIKLPKSMTLIAQSVFSGCSRLEEVIIPDTVTAIRNWAFDGCTSLNDIVVPNSVSIIANSAFRGVHCVIYSGNAVGSPWGALQIKPN